MKDVLAEPDGAKKEKDKDKKDDDEKKEKKKEEKFEYELATAYERVRRVTSLPGDQASFALAPDGASLAFVSSHDGPAALYSIKWNGEDVKKGLAGAFSSLHWALDGQRVFYVKNGVPGSGKSGGGDTKDHAFAAKMRISPRDEAEQKFNEGARMMGLRFYHPTMKGLDWPALTQRHRELALRTSTIVEFNEVFSMLLGELNASHCGISGPREGGGDPLGYLGTTFDPAFAGPGLRIAAVTPESPADREESRLRPGDVILKVSGRSVGPDASIEEALINTVGDPVILEILSIHAPASAPATSSAPASEPAPSSSTAPNATAPASAPAPREVVIRPCSYGEFAAQRYRAWVAENRRRVDEQSSGRVGYLHIRAMGAGEFDVFERDLYAAAHGKDGLIIDVRNNTGGWTADWVLAVLMVQRHAWTVSRGGVSGYPQDRLVFYSWTKPTTMMCNQYSFSNGEIISHAFKNLKRGPLVGMTTYGGVISTGAHTLIDGATVRMPGRGWYTIPGGNDMELNGAAPDVLVPILPEDETAGRDPQLDAAVTATLGAMSDE